MVQRVARIHRERRSLCCGRRGHDRVQLGGFARIDEQSPTRKPADVGIRIAQDGCQNRCRSGVGRLFQNHQRPLPGRTVRIAGQRVEGVDVARVQGHQGQGVRSASMHHGGPITQIGDQFGLGAGRFIIQPGTQGLRPLGGIQHAVGRPAAPGHVQAFQGERIGQRVGNVAVETGVAVVIVDDVVGEGAIPLARQVEQPTGLCEVGLDRIVAALGGTQRGPQVIEEATRMTGFIFGESGGRHFGEVFALLLLALGQAEQQRGTATLAVAGELRGAWFVLSVGNGSPTRIGTVESETAVDAFIQLGMADVALFGQQQAVEPGNRRRVDGAVARHHRSHRIVRPFETRKDMPEGSEDALPCGDGIDVGFDRLKHPAVRMLSVCQVILGQGDQCVSPLPAGLFDARQHSANREQGLDLGINLRLHGGMVRVSRIVESHQRQRSHPIGSGVVGGQERLASAFGNQGALRVGNRRIGTVGTEGLESQGHGRGDTRAPDPQFQLRRSPGFGRGDRESQRFARVRGEIDRNGTIAAGTEDDVIDQHSGRDRGRAGSHRSHQDLAALPRVVVITQQSLWILLTIHPAGQAGGSEVDVPVVVGHPAVC